MEAALKRPRTDFKGLVMQIRTYLSMGEAEMEAKCLKHMEREGKEMPQ